MLKFYKTVDKVIVEIDEIEPGCWISAILPTENEIFKLETELKIDRDYIRSALDEEEVSRIDRDDGQTLIMIDYPVAAPANERGADTTDKTAIIAGAIDTARDGGGKFRRKANKGKHDDDGIMSYYTLPMGIILTDCNVVTVCTKTNPIIEEFAKGVLRDIRTEFKTQFVFNILLRVAGRYLNYLKQIDKLSVFVENQLHKSLKNKELLQLLSLEKSLVYFSTSLKSTETTLEKILRGRVIRLYEDDKDLLDDVLIEVKQAIEMSHIYSDILSGTMDAFASIISNNLNIVMKVLAIITLVMQMPTMVFSFFGINVGASEAASTSWTAIGISVVLSVVSALVLLKADFQG